MIRTPRRGRPGSILTSVVALAVVAGGATLATASLTGPATAAPGDPYMNASLPVASRVTDLMSRMSLDDKIGQMTQADHNALTNQQDVASYRLGSVLSGGGSGPSDISANGWANSYDALQRIALSTPLQIPIIYGIDAVHGHNKVRGATVFPHNIGLGATRDPALVERIGRATAEEVAGTGIDWTFSPCLCVARNDRWGRTYESFSENPELVTQMSTIITGYQGSTLSNPSSILATAKHYVGDGGTTNGVDQGNTQLSEAELRSIHLPPFRAAVERNVGSVMLSYSSWNGQKLHGHRYLVTDVLKGELGFQGFVVSDWAGIDQLDGGRGFTAAEVATAVNAGIDMVMVPNDYALFISYLRQNVQNGTVPQSRIDDAVRRILTKKFELGLFERPYTDRSLTGTVGSQAHRDLAREAVRKSAVLLKNQNGILPLAKSGSRIFVAGKNADNIGNQSGGWTIDWQGSSGNITPGTTILAGVRAAAPGNTVTYNATGTGIDSSYDVAIAVVGETPYAEGQGDRTGSMSLDTTDLSTISRLRAAGVPVVVVLVSGRPMDIAAELGTWAALVAAWLPGTEGQGVADVLFGDHNPTGKLPMTWMQSASQQPINEGDGKTPLFPYGFGLSYSGTTTTTTTTTTTPTTTTTRTTTPTTTTTRSTTTRTRTTTTRSTTRTTTTTTRTTTPTTTTTTTPTTTTSSTTTTTSTTRGCSATYRVISSWGGGFQGEVAVTAGSSPINGWTVTWTYANGQAVTQAWNATVTSSGSSVTARNLSWNASLGSGASTTFGFLGSWNGTNSVPSLSCTAS